MNGGTDPETSGWNGRVKIDFQIIAHEKQRYPTVGDYFQKHGSRQGWWHFRVSRLPDARYCWLVFLHEIIEWAICRLTKVKMGAITRFDVAYEKARTAYKHAVDDKCHSALLSDPVNCAPCGCSFQEEPGNDPHAPYHVAHQTATACERLIAKALGVNWQDYSDAVNVLDEEVQNGLAEGTTEKPETAY